MSDSLLRLPSVIKKTGLPKATIYALIKQEKFPSPVKLIPGGRAVAWNESIINEWIQSRPEAISGEDDRL